MTDQQRCNLTREAALAGYDCESFTMYSRLAAKHALNKDTKRAAVAAACALRAYEKYPHLYPNVTGDQVETMKLLVGH